MANAMDLHLVELGSDLHCQLHESLVVSWQASSQNIPACQKMFHFISVRAHFPNQQQRNHNDNDDIIHISLPP